MRMRKGSIAVVFAMVVGAFGASLFAQEPPPQPAPPRPAATGQPGTVIATEPVIPPEEQTRYRQLISTVQDQFELDPRYNGVLVADALILPGEADGSRVIRVRGKVVGEDQRDLVIGMFAAALAADPYWAPRQDTINVVPEELIVLPLAPTLAARYYGIGIDYFWQGNYRLADLAFARAIAESPADAGLRYWSVLTALMLGQQERAEMKLRPLVRQYPYGSSTVGLANELQRVQGPLRWRLMSLERKVLLEDVPGLPAGLVPLLDEDDVDPDGTMPYEEPPPGV